MIEQVFLRFESQIQDRAFAAATLRPLKDAFVSSDEVH